MAISILRRNSILRKLAEYAPSGVAASHEDLLANASENKELSRRMGRPQAQIDRTTAGYTTAPSDREAWHELTRGGGSQIMPSGGVGVGYNTRRDGSNLAPGWAKPLGSGGPGAQAFYDSKPDWNKAAPVPAPTATAFKTTVPIVPAPSTSPSTGSSVGVQPNKQPNASAWVGGRGRI